MLDIPAALEAVFEETSYMDFYRDLFPEGSFEEKGVQVPGGYNGIAVAIGRRTRRKTVTDELDVIEEMAISDDFCIMSPISYAGKSRKSENARFMYALAIDLDGVKTMKNWTVLMKQIEEGETMRRGVWGLPKPTYLVSSGTGIHIYYVFEKPVPMFKKTKEQLEKLKKRLTYQAWTMGASELHDNVQYESLFQGFRMVGTITKTGGRCRAFRVGEKITIEYLNEFVPVKYQVKRFTYKSDLRLADAAKKYPDWYQRRVIEKRKPGTWVCKKDLYDWWIRQIYQGAAQGHRYWCVMTLATYAKKCGVPKDVLKEDAYGLIPYLSAIGDEFTEDDVKAALAAFDDSYITYPIHAISDRTGIFIEKNRRNGRKQSVHLRIQRRTLEELNIENGSPLQGRKSEKDTVGEWRNSHPDGSKADCIRDTGLSKPTVYKWWGEEKTPQQRVVDWQDQHPDGSKADCIRDTGLSKPTVQMVGFSGESNRKESATMVCRDSLSDRGGVAGEASNWQQG